MTVKWSLRSLVDYSKHFILHYSKIKAIGGSWKCTVAVLAVDVLAASFDVISVRKVGVRVLVGVALIRNMKISSIPKVRTIKIVNKLVYARWWAPSSVWDQVKVERCVCRHRLQSCCLLHSKDIWWTLQWSCRTKSSVLWVCWECCRISYERLSP